MFSACVCVFIYSEYTQFNNDFAYGTVKALLKLLGYLIPKHLINRLFCFVHFPMHAARRTVIDIRVVSITISYQSRDSFYRNQRDQT